MQTLEVPITDDLVNQNGTSSWRSERIDTTAFTMTAFIWARQSSRTPTVRIRTRTRSGWGRWIDLPPVHEVPEQDAGSTADHTGTEVIWVGRSTGIQFEIFGARPPRLQLVLLHPLPNPSDIRPQPAAAARKSGVQTARRSVNQLLRPAILRRSEWGADEGWRDGAARYNHTMQQVHVHHTASGNSYSQAEVPALIRGMYRYHTHNLGWSDIAYNFLIDRYGRIWEGRAGGPGRAVRGAHTRGFNATSTGVAVIGNYELTSPGQPTIDALARLAAWKVYRFRGQPGGRVDVTSEGSDLFRVGREVSLPVIDGHRDTNQTACPGRHLYALLPQIRRQAEELIASAKRQANAVLVLTPPSLSGAPIVGGQLTVTPGTYDPPEATVGYTWLRNGQPIEGATGPTYRCAAADYGADLAVVARIRAPGFATASQTLNAAATVLGRPRVVLRSVVEGRTVRVRIRVRPPAGATEVAAGRVVVRLRRRLRALDLVEGSATAVFRGVRRGRWPVSVAYGGSGDLLPAEGRSQVDVR